MAGGPRTLACVAPVRAHTPDDCPWCESRISRGLCVTRSDRSPTVHRRPSTACSAPPAQHSLLLYPRCSISMAMACLGRTARQQVPLACVRLTVEYTRGRPYGVDAIECADQHAESLGIRLRQSARSFLPGARVAPRRVSALAAPRATGLDGYRQNVPVGGDRSSSVVENWAGTEARDR